MTTNAPQRVTVRRVGEARQAKSKPGSALLRTGLHLGSLGMVILILGATLVLAAAVVVVGLAMAVIGMVKAWRFGRRTRSAIEPPESNDP